MNKLNLYCKNRKTIDKIKRKIQRSIQSKLQNNKKRVASHLQKQRNKSPTTMLPLKTRKDFLNQKYNGP